VIPIALRYGKPVIATSVGGLPEAVIHGKTGVLVPPRSPEALADAIAAMGAERAAAMSGDVRALAASLTWDGLGRTVLDTLGSPS
jgi:glycosyltransferase involved in cell wall biosynthesis